MSWGLAKPMGESRLYPAVAFVVSVILFLYLFALGVQNDATGEFIGLFTGLFLVLTIYSFRRTFL